MKWQKGIGLLAFTLVIVLTSCGQSGDGQQQNDSSSPEQNHEEEAEVRTQAQLYIDAVNSRNLDKIVQFWSPEAVYRNPITGDLVQGREGIKKELAKIFDQLKEGTIEFRIQAIRFPHEDKASEEGISVLTIPGEEPIHSDYKMIHVKENGKWLILHVSQLDFGMLDQNPENSEPEY